MAMPKIKFIKYQFLTLGELLTNKTGSSLVTSELLDKRKA